MMTNEQKLIMQLIDGFMELKGNASCYAFKPLKPENIITTFINLHRKKREDSTIFIVVRDYEERLKIKDILEKHNLIDNVTILTKTYINLKYKYEYYFTFIIGCNEDYNLINHLYKQSRFTLNILTESTTNGVFNYWINNNLPIIKTNINTNDIVKDRINYPVEETHLFVNISDEDRDLLNKYDEYVKTSMNVFGSFENADKCRIGDINLNISAGEFRYTFAKENGWSEILDTNVEFNKNIDDIYNPNALFERANTLYNIIRERNNLLSDNNAKLNKIVEIITKHHNEKIIIVSKRGEFANTIANYINDNTEYLCGEYHDCIPEQYIQDENGEYVVYKSGENKGKRKLFKSSALSTMCLNRFNSKDKSQEINLLSIKNSSDVKLKTATKVVIFTSSLCSPINEFIQRYDNIDFISNPLISYVICCNDSSEQNKLQNRTYLKNVNIIEEEKNFIIDEKSGEIYL